MSATTTGASPSGRFKTKHVIGAAVVVVLLVAMGVDTAVVPTGSTVATGKQFDPATYGQKHFPDIRDAITQHAVPATKLARALNTDKAGAVDQYAIGSGSAPVLPVKFSGVVGTGQLGTYTVKVEGVAEDITIKVQTGPAILGTALRDAAPDIGFGDFTNQIQYQNAAAGINTAMKKDILADLERDQLKGQTVTVVGAFKLTTPDSWRVTPVKISVQP